MRQGAMTGRTRRSLATISSRGQDEVPTTQMKAAEAVRALGLGGNQYKDLYASIERILMDADLIACTYRSTSQRQVGFAAATTCFTSSQTARTDFPDAVSAINRPEGLRAFRKLVYIISGNYRRRTAARRQRSNHTSTAQLSTDCGPRRAHTEMEYAGDPDPIDANPYPHQLDRRMISISREGGVLKAVCRPSDLALALKGALPTLNDLSWTSFIRILCKDHHLNEDEEFVTWLDDESKPQCSIDNCRQWKAVMAEHMEQNRSLSFAIVKYPTTPRRGRR